ncbi:antitoxin Xre/MbcA/ParS toxin-binding domain-containing protein [Lysobacter claricitrinus]|uniref:antitoxin Xre/MbcA/ParS toxin-binding domain-containing protein n=1 Tax=Lysobacter claricitrinus TaxID=3367728 RepID=UPI0037DA7EEA
MGIPNQHHHAVHVAHGDGRSSPEALALDARRALAALRLGAGELAGLLGVDDAMVATIQNGSARVPSGSDLARHLLLLVRLHRGLGDVYGSTERMDQWLDATDPALNAKPRALMKTMDGLKRVVANVEGRCKDCLW